jgi:hypothetical protein
MFEQAILDQIQQMYIAYYGRPADVGGLNNWAQHLVDNNGDASAIIDAFGKSPEYTDRFGDLSNEELVNNLYQQLFNRDADPVGLELYTGLLASGEQTLGSIALTIMANASGDTDPVIVANKLAVANAFTAELKANEAAANAYVGNDAADKAAAMLSTVNETTDIDAFDISATIDELISADSGTFTLTKGLEALAAAQTERAEFLQATYAANEDVKAATTVAGAEPTADEIDAGVVKVLDDSIAAVNNATGAVGDISKTRTDAYNTAIINEQKTVNQKAVDDAQKNVDAVTGLDAAITTLKAAQADLEAAIDAQVDTNVDVLGAEVAFETADNGANAGTITLQYGSVTTGVFSADVVDATDLSAADVLVVDNNSDAVIEVNSKGEIVVASAYEGEAKAAELLAAVKADVAAMQALVAATDALEEAVATVVVLEGTNEITTEGVSSYVDTKGGSLTEDGELYVKDGVTYVAVANATTNVAFYSVTDIAVTVAADGSLTVEATYDSTAADETVTYNASVAQTATDGGYTVVSATDPLAFTAADLDASAFIDTTTDSLLVEGGGTNDFEAIAADSFALISALATQETFNEAVEDYLAAKALNDEMEGLNDAVTAAREALENDVEDGGLGINLLEGSSNFTVDDDVYLFNADNGDLTLTKFGANGDDKIFFGEEFTLVAIPDGEDINDNVGDVAALEILWDQQGTNLVLYVEGETFGGNSAGTDDVVQITLSGVNAADVSFEGGFLTIA